MLFQPRNAKLEDAFDDIDIKTGEGDIADVLDYEGEEVGVNVIMKMNRFVKDIYFVVNSSLQTMGKIIFGAVIQPFVPVAVYLALNGVWTGVLRAVGAVYYVRVVQLLGCIEAHHTFADKSGEDKLLRQLLDQMVNKLDKLLSPSPTIMLHKLNTKSVKLEKFVT